MWNPTFTLFSTNVPTQPRCVGPAPHASAIMSAAAAAPRVAALALKAARRVGARRALVLAAHADRAVWAALSGAEAALQRALPPSARAGAGAYLASGVGASAGGRLLHGACARVAVSDGLPLALVLFVLGLAAGFVCGVTSAWVVPWGWRVVGWVPGAVRRGVMGSSLVRARVDGELRKLEGKLQAEFAVDPAAMSFLTLPSAGVEEAAVASELRRCAASEEERWASGKLSGAVYHARDAADRIAGVAFNAFSLSNPMHPNATPSVRRMESEVLSMTASLFSCPTPACGALTSGGSESILMAMRAYRQRARARGISRPNIVVPVTIHAAFDKACDYFCIEIRKVAIDPETQRAVPRAMRRRLDGNTIAMCCSAVAFPHGTLDPVQELGAIATAYRVGLHVDACLGSFLLPWGGLPSFDFSASAAVTSMSVDHHKYGLAPKGVSCVLFRSKELRAYMFSRSPEWTGGIYATATASGSRPGALIAGAWAAMVVTGRAGYVDQARVVLGAARSLADGIRKIDGLRVVGEPALSVVAFTTTAESRINIFNVLDALSGRGWDLNALQYPAALHACVTLPMAPVVGRLVTDLRDVVGDLAKKVEEGQTVSDGSGAALYGMATTVPREITSECIDTYLSCVLSPPKSEAPDDSP